ncbi:XkdF-like putative serine protease domain-containing protein [Tumebacillus permanentifrigoris]|uniref:SPP1 gp7 family putative phage head morphogenesis protein n=1 Tax=Tumebacillus permanentifrigoris TaxID=378543 RepID=A0A316D4K7_9BACL|nr:XkdF-like putative serine protease domain-containing protein [Tumebacillus permanentifrigoris]PWK07506.1 SPP1 gp7 family putative phage head morphogenesis protein [Tumebacillus permanentifrigoris]
MASRKKPTTPNMQTLKTLWSKLIDGIWKSDDTQPPDWLALQEIADLHSPELIKAFIDAVKKTQSDTVLEKVEAAFSTGDVKAVEASINWKTLTKELERTVQPVLQKVAEQAARAEVPVTSKKIGVEVAFKQTNPLAQRWASEKCGELIVQVTEETKQATRQIIEHAFEKGGHPRESAKLIVDHIGLTEADAKRVVEARTDLLNSGATSEQADAKVEALSRDLLEQRAENIARTETINASNNGQNLLWEQAREDGYLDDNLFMKEWIATPGDRTCPTCMAMNGKRAPIDGEFANGLKCPTLHPRCRCAMGLVEVEELDLTKGHSGLWVGFWLSPETAKQLAIPGGEAPEDMHLTLTYSPNATGEATKRAIEAMKNIAQALPPVAGEASGVGRFYASETSGGVDVVYSSFDAPLLPDFRHAVVDALETAGAPPSRAHGYTPHITLAYVEQDVDALVTHGDSVPIVFDSIQVRVGDDEVHTFPLTGDGAARAQNGFVTFDVGKSDLAPEDDWTAPLSITKTDTEKQMVFGWLSVSVTAEGVQVIDLHGDIIEEHELEAAAYDFVLHARIAGEMHERFEGIGRLVESTVFTAEKQRAWGIPEGIMPIGWWVGFKIDDPDVWAKVKSGEYGAFSIGGKAIRVPV